MLRNLVITIALFAVMFAVNGCGRADSTATTTTEGAGVTAGVLPGPDNSEIRTETVGGVTTETRTFRDPNSPIEKVVVTKRDGRRSARVHYRDGTARDLPDSAVETALVETGDKLEDVGGAIVDVSKEVGSEAADKVEDAGDKAKSVAGEVGDKAEDVKDQTVSGAKKVGSEAADKAEDVGDKAASGAKKAGKATVKGAKKVGSAVKDAVTP